MAQKQLLHELLQQDQEPFFLRNYIADRKVQIRKAPPKIQLQLRKPKPISKNFNFGSTLCKNACFLSFHESPEPRRSPIFDLRSPPKSPCKNPNAVFLHIPSALIEAALRIQKQTSKNKPQNRNTGFGLLGSFLKRITNRSGNRNCEIAVDGVSVKDILRLGDSSVGRRKLEEKQGKTKSFSGEVSAFCERGFSCSSNDRRSSAVWSETNEEKSLDLSTSASSQSEDLESMERFVSSAFGFCEDSFCDSPFHFVLQRSPTHGGDRTPFFSSPTASRVCHKKEDKGNCEVEGLNKFQLGEEEEEKEQNSPVSVLDPPFGDDEDGQVEADVDNEFDLESSYAIVQRTKQQLLQKLRRFEKLAELDPVELEKRMLEQEEDDDDGDDDYEDELVIEQHKFDSSKEEMNLDGLVKELFQSNFHQAKQTPEGINKLVLDLIAEENSEQKCCSKTESVIKSVLNRLESWKLVESNTIDMMVEGDLRSEVELWKKNQQQLEEITMEIEFAIFGLLVGELSEEISCFKSI